MGLPTLPESVSFHMTINNPPQLTTGGSGSGSWGAGGGGSLPTAPNAEQPIIKLQYRTFIENKAFGE